MPQLRQGDSPTDGREPWQVGASWRLDLVRCQRDRESRTAMNLDHDERDRIARAEHRSGVHATKEAGPQNDCPTCRAAARCADCGAPLYRLIRAHHHTENGQDVTTARCTCEPLPEPVNEACPLHGLDAVPTCDICGQPDGDVPTDWNGETGNHLSCEAREYRRGA
jgi:hypothetical protein